MAAKRTKKQSKKATTSPPKGREQTRGASKKTASKKTASKKTASKKTASKKTASKKTASKKTASKKTASKKTASKKTAQRSTKPATKANASKAVGPNAATAARSSSVTPSAKKKKPSEAEPKSTVTSTTRSSKPAKDASAQQSLFDESGSVPAKGVGGKVPDFALNDQDGTRVTRSALLGAPFVLYFYPKDDTPGCTKEACDFRDQISAFKGLGARVVGVSPDSEASHKKFANKYGLDFTLLSDPDKTLCSALGVWQLKKNYGREYMGVVRSTFVIQSDGVVVRAFRGVKVAGHVPSVIEALKGVS